ncbi:unnamed protein product [Closterium sp. Naga37s-1]|nr:unnamed protein product [Closterium sp. Naga37s-1]
MARGARLWCAIPFAAHALFRRAPTKRNVLALLLVLALVVLLAIVQWRAPPQQPTLISGMSASSSSRPTSAELYEAWAQLFALAAPLPPSAMRIPASLPPPPHLEDCASRTAFRLATERRGARGKAIENGTPQGVGGEGEGDAPEWARASAACANVPQPPWVRGADAANLGSTRVVQRDLWAHQFPPGPCEGRRLLLVHWPHPDVPSTDAHGSNSESGVGRIGLGASEVAEQLVAMAGALSVAVSSQRVLVPMPGSFLPANHSHCQVVNESGSLNCYFFRSVSAACEAAAMQQYSAAGSPPCRPLSQLAHVIASNDSLVCALATLYPSSRPHSAAARAWGDAYKQRPYLVEERGVMVNASEEHMQPSLFLSPPTPLSVPQAYWWQAQALRFLLRWPSALLCHATNRMRHSAYGLQTAVLAAAQVAEQRAILAALWSPFSDAHQHLGIDIRSEARLLGALDFSQPHNLETDVWPALGFAGCADGVDVGTGGNDVKGESVGSEGREGGGERGVREEGGAGAESADEEENVPEEKPAALVTYERVGKEVGMPRPVVSMHVEQQAGGGVDALRPLLALTHRVRHLDPATTFAWLSAQHLVGARVLGGREVGAGLNAPASLHGTWCMWLSAHSLVHAGEAGG